MIRSASERDYSATNDYGASFWKQGTAIVLYICWFFFTEYSSCRPNGHATRDRIMGLSYLTGGDFRWINKSGEYGSRARECPPKVKTRAIWCSLPC